MILLPFNQMYSSFCKPTPQLAGRDPATSVLLCQLNKIWRHQAVSSFSLKSRTNETAPPTQYWMLDWCLAQVSTRFISVNSNKYFLSQNAFLWLDSSAKAHWVTSKETGDPEKNGPCQESSMLNKEMISSSIMSGLEAHR